MLILDEMTREDMRNAGEALYTSVSDTERVLDLRQRVRRAMEHPPVGSAHSGELPPIDRRFMAEPLAVRKARAIALKLAHMPTDLWAGQLFAGSITLEHPRVHYEKGFPDYLTDEERTAARERGMGIGCFGHIVPDYPCLLRKGLRGIIADAEAQRPMAENAEALAFLDAVVITLDAVMAFAVRLAEQCERDAAAEPDAQRAAELYRMAANLRQVPAGPAKTFWQALQSVWLIHMIFPAILQNNALGRLDQYTWPYLEADLYAGRLNWTEAAELVDCFCLKFNERAKTTEDQLPDHRDDVDNMPLKRTRHRTSSQFGTRRDRLDATNHWLQNIIIGGLTPEGVDGTNPLSFLLLRSYQRNKMTNPLLTLRVHPDSPEAILRCTCEVLKDGGGMPAIFNDDALIPALERLGIPTPDARDYTNDGCWEVIIPGRTDFRFMRLSLMLCLEWALNHGYSRVDGDHDEDDVFRHGVDTGDPRQFTAFDDVMQAFLTQLDAMVGRTVRHVIETLNLRSTVAPVPLLSALTAGAITARRDLTAGGAKFRTFGMLAESAAHTIDSLVAIKTVVFENREATMAELCDALDANFKGYAPLRAKLQAAPKYGNDDERADAIGRAVIKAFVDTVNRHAQDHMSLIKFPCGVATFSWYIGIGQGLGASPDGRLAGQPVSSNFSPALGRDMEGIPGAILSYAKMHHSNLPAGGPLDLRLPKTLVKDTAGTRRMVALLRSFCETGGSMMTLTVADTEELRAAQAEPNKYKSLRVRMGGWCAYFTMLSHEQQTHHIRRQEGR